jgi:uncharacterized metal-binding protein
VDVEGEEEEAFGKLDAFPPEKRWTGIWLWLSCTRSISSRSQWRTKILGSNEIDIYIRGNWLFLICCGLTPSYPQFPVSFSP